MRRWIVLLWFVLAWPLAAAERAEDGVWWNPAASGTGFQIERQGDTYTMAFYLYEPDGSQLWLTSVATWEAMPIALTASAACTARCIARAMASVSVARTGRRA